MKLTIPILYIVATAMSLTSCAQKSERKEKDSSIAIIDNMIYSKFSSCDVNANVKFNDFLGVQISKDFQILDSLKLNVNEDMTPDYVIVLSPVIQEEEQFKSPCYKFSHNRRLLVILSSSPNGYTVNTVAENAIVNKSEYQSEPFRKLLSTKDGFGLSFFIGSVNKCTYEFYFKKSKNGYFLDSSVYNCYKTDLSANAEKKEAHKISDSTNIKNIDIRTYLVIPKF